MFLDLCNPRSETESRAIHDDGMAYIRGHLRLAQIALRPLVVLVVIVCYNVYMYIQVYIYARGSIEKLIAI